VIPGLLIAAFVAGALAGAAGDRLLHAGEPRFHEARGRHGHDRMAVFIDELDLSSQQRARVEAALERRRPQAEAIWESVKPRLRAQIDSTNAEIRALLTPEQQEAFDRKLRELEQRRRQGWSASSRESR
jgi:Spy/CpxP family protein refolding chaperone